ncbi:MAG: riboflavin synthase [Hydrogenibacillus sp.]|nr:riboflavin synthase [Hydrogenibacillus sp.]
MFTGLIEAVGIVDAVEDLPDGGRALAVRLAGELGDIRPGDSLAVDGVCLTAVSVGAGVARFDAVRETLAKTTLGRLAPGARVNLERALTPASRLGGHFVTGHVDGVGRLREVARAARAEAGYDVRIEAPPEVMAYVVPQGSIAVDGISLTVAEVFADGFRVAIIPYTWRHTALSDKTAGSAVNLEADVLAKIVVQSIRRPFSALVGASGAGHGWRAPEGPEVSGKEEGANE